ncbi:pilus assembly PilX N-terminal domain-containing protein [Candidatus Falkowbacteria bacterium]|nr:pilus assembly PilX N-terminal domain-containing protein [Candidatus Falkowbacteria bacterium]
MTDEKAKNQKGFVLVISVVILTTLLMIGSYLLSLANSEQKIASAQSLATTNYYLAEAGIHDMIWKIQNDQSARDAFLNGTLSSSYDINKSNIFGDSNMGYQVSAISTVNAEAWIIATSTYQIGNNTSQRVVKSYITRPTDSGEEWEFGTFAGGRGSQQNGNFRFNGAGIVLTANGGRLHANQEFKVQGAELIINDGAVTSANVINVVAGGTLTLNNSYQDAPTTTVEMLIIDFDSADSDSWENRATVTYSEDDFEDLPSGTVLSGIIYVNGEAKIIGKNMTINGVLVAEEDLKITLSGQTLQINFDSTYGGGLLSKEDIEITTSGGTVAIDGLVYAADDLDITSSGTNFTIDGSLTAFDAEITASGGSIILNFVPENYEPVIGPIYNPESPLIQIDHWEEQY